MHFILGSQGQWSGAGGFNVEGDFVECGVWKGGSTMRAFSGLPGIYSPVVFDK